MRLYKLDRYIVLLILLACFIFLNGCADNNNTVTNQDLACEVVDAHDGIYFACADGSRRYLHDGEDRFRANDYVELDPCGPHAGVSETLFIFNDGSAFSYLPNIGLFTIKPNVVYTTNDTQRCQYQVVKGEMVIL